MAKYVEGDQSQLFLLPVDMRDWVDEDDLAHFVLEAVDRVPMSAFVVNERGTGSAQYHPRMMLALLVYCYANGIFGSRRIERATYRDIGVRYVASNCHPDHDTICAFRRNNFEAVAKAFEQVLLLAKELKLLRLGTVSVDGTKVDANANKGNNIRYDPAQELRGEIEALLNRAEQEDNEEAVEPQGLPHELSRRERLRERLDQACAELERRARAAAGAERASYERKMSERERMRRPCAHDRGRPVFRPPNRTPRPRPARLGEGLEVDPGATLGAVGARVGDRRGRLRGEEGEHLLVLFGERLATGLLGEENVPDLRTPVAHRRALEDPRERRRGLDAKRADVAREVGEAKRPERPRRCSNSRTLSAQARSSRSSSGVTPENTKPPGAPASPTVATKP